MLKIKDQANKCLMTDKSKKLFNKLQLRRLKEMFDVIDGDNDGEISENSFLNAQLPHRTVALLRPIIKLGVKLDFSGFLEQLQLLLNVSQFVSSVYFNYIFNFIN